ncbi:mechanosensitive ion channel protein MscS [Cohnella sp. CIP 111063]|uniref:mechanosensitive ion channel family protein n=1 Tax=unclassified Cohnella TaxID=2636738 RepID=UPI000B8C5272|nr:MULTISPECIES: mechanosensitive ion channel domain-containing protein [unclassified Cohnella]OXS59351.1 mechanosensitive ion channel protein MscS [Cohnella sp. CIP 111063]PRX72380.1 miniconductance mechanosensitive channel [Cohnella sp. SGD-V74]
MDFIKQLLVEQGVSSQIAVYLANMIVILLIVGVSVVANFVTKKIVLRVIASVILKNRFTWDNVFLERKVFHRLSHIVPAIIIYFSAPLFPGYQTFIEKGAAIYIIVVSMMVIDAFLNACNDIYNSYEISKVKPIRGYTQVIKIFVFIIGAIVIISGLIGESPLILLSGLGALSAVLMLIFKDSILGLVAGVQLSANDMVRVGDWIEMPKYNADGDVIDISLNTVKVLNFDKTITTIPSYALISDSFRNWRGMRQAGGRRIKRSVHIDTTSICFCSGEMLERFRKVQLLTDYIESREREIAEYNDRNAIDKTMEINGRQLTNIGVFRMYVESYLRHHPKIHQSLTLLVRQLAPTENGLPLEVYAFVNDTNWSVYESAQSDIFDHIFAAAPSFGLRIFQNPTGYDFSQALRSDV